MMERMLGNVSHAKTRSLPDRSCSWFRLAHKDLNGCGFACAVRADNSHTADLRNSETHIHDRWFILRRVLEGDVLHLQHESTSTLHAFHWAWFRKFELHDFVGQFEVRLLIGVFLNPLSQSFAFITH